MLFLQETEYNSFGKFSVLLFVWDTETMLRK